MASSSVVEHSAVNRAVVGSTPTLPEEYIMPAFGSGALQDLLEKLRLSRDKSVNKKARKGTRKGKTQGSHKPTVGRTRKQIMDDLT